MNTSRRNLLRAAGVSLSLPLLESYGETPSKSRPSRMLAINQDLGFIPRRFFPETSGRDYAPSPYLQKLAPHREEFTVFSGLSHLGVDGGHRADKTFLTGAPHPGRASFRNTISLDQVIANQVGHETRFRSLALGINDSRSLSYTQSGVEIPTIQNAGDLYRKMFLQGDRKAMETQIARLQSKKSILDVVMGQSAELTKRVNTSDRQRIDQFHTAVRSLEQRLTEAQAWEARPRPVVDAPTPDYPTDKKQFFEMVRMMNDMSRLAFQTDSTRVITLFLGGVRTPGVNLSDGRSIGGYHNLSHHGKDETKLKKLAEIEVGQLELFGELLQSLKDVEEPDGTLLSRTMVLYGCHMGDANIHNNTNLPIILAGGGFRHGQHLAFNRANNRPLANLYLSMLHKMGLEANQFASSTGTLNGLS